MNIERQIEFDKVKEMWAELAVVLCQDLVQNKMRGSAS